MTEGPNLNIINEIAENMEGDIMPDASVMPKIPDPPKLPNGRLPRKMYRGGGSGDSNSGGSTFLGINFSNIFCMQNILIFAAVTLLVIVVIYWYRQTKKQEPESQKEPEKRKSEEELLNNLRGEEEETIPIEDILKSLQYKLIGDGTDNTVYFVFDGEKRPLSSKDVMDFLGERFHQRNVELIPQNVLNMIPDGDLIDENSMQKVQAEIAHRQTLPPGVM